MTPEQAEVALGLKYVFTRIEPFIESGNGEAFYFTFEGVEYFVESWSTHHGAGEDFYDVSTGAAVDMVDLEHFDDEEFDAVLQAVKDAWYDAWARHVAEAVKRAQTLALEAQFQVEPEQPASTS